VEEKDFDPEAPIQPTKTVITEETFKTGVTIPLTVSGGDQPGAVYGTIVVPPRLIPVGWTIKITPVNESELEKPKPKSSSDNQCDSTIDEEEQRVDSVAFNMVILDQRGRERSLQKLLEREHSKEGIRITLAYSLNKAQRKSFSPDDLKFIYLQDGDESWKLSADDVTVSGKGFGNITTTISHLTSKKEFNIT